MSVDQIVAHGRGDSASGTVSQLLPPVLSQDTPSSLPNFGGQEAEPIVMHRKLAETRDSKGERMKLVCVEDMVKMLTQSSL